MPDWVIDATNGKRGHEIEHGHSSDDSDDGKVEYSAQPLAMLLRDAAGLAEGSTRKNKKRKLRPEVVNIQRLKNIANSGPSAITCLQIHPTLPFLIASGPSAQLDIYHLHSKPPDHSTAVTSLFVAKTPLTTTAFSPLASDPRVFLSARRRYFHAWNLATGAVDRVTRVYGHAAEQRSMERFRVSPTGGHIAFAGTARRGGAAAVNVLDLATLQWAAHARVGGEGGVADFCWWRDGAGLCVAARDGAVTEWSLRERRAVARWRDEGAVGTTTLALGGRSGRAELGGDRWVAVGSASGVVNVYSRRQGRRRARGRGRRPGTRTGTRAWTAATTTTASRRTRGPPRRRGRCARSTSSRRPSATSPSRPTGRRCASPAGGSATRCASRTCPRRPSSATGPRRPRRSGAGQRRRLGRGRGGAEARRRERGREGHVLGSARVAARPSAVVVFLSAVTKAAWALARWARCRWGRRRRVRAGQVHVDAAQHLAAQGLVGALPPQVAQRLAAARPLLAAQQRRSAVSRRRFRAEDDADDDAAAVG